MTWPNLFIVGVAKAGTTTLHNLLNTHPNITMSSVKEPHFFSRNIYDDNIDKSHAQLIFNKKDYLALFDTSSHSRYFGESSPSYMWDKQVPERIKEKCKNSKIIILLRDPISRIFSHYHMDFAAGREKNISLIKAIEDDQSRAEKWWGKSRLYLELGYYAESIRNFQKHLGEENLLILHYETFFKNLELEIKKVYQFLDLEDVATKPIKNTNPGNYLNTPLKILKMAPGVSYLPKKWKTFLVKRLKSKAPKPTLKEISFLWNHYQTDLLELHSMGIEFYTDYMASTYQKNVLY